MIPAMGFLIAFAIVNLTVCLATEAASQDQQASQKRAVIQALNELYQELRRVSVMYSVGGNYANSLRWLGSAAETWRPVSADEGRGMRDSLERMTMSIRSAGAHPAGLKSLVEAIEEDLEEKRQYCARFGLAMKNRVKVVTKRDGTAEVQGLEVLYLEKFLAADPKATPQTFRGFSSPATDELVPGRYMFWAKEPGVSGRSGKRKEASVGLKSEDAVEVLSP
jgi:hypothetical protein